ncbi:hypothetical protein N0V95_002470 [Ascochyta clinopodiicola]|nr:hypothetical protein N0V95_002470 [Ascochyta clinopodiicola]
MSQQNYRPRHQNYDAYAPLKRNPYDELNSRSGSVSSSASTYTNPPSPVLRPRALPHIGEGRTTAESVSHSIRAANAAYTEVSGRRISDQYVSATQNQAYPQFEPTYESFGLSSTTSLYRPRTPPMRHFPLSLEAVHQRLPGLTHPLPEPLSKYLRVATPSSSTSTRPSHMVTIASPTALFTSSASKTEKARRKKKMPEAPTESMNEPRFDSPESVEPTYEGGRLQVDLQDTTKKLEMAFRDPRMNKGESARRKKLPEKMHRTLQPCQQFLPSLSHRQLAFKREPPPTKIVPGKGCTEPNRYIDLVERQNASWACYRQNDALSGNETLQNDEQKKACDLVKEAAIKSETHWRSEADKVTQELKDLGKQVQVNSAVTVCGRNEAPKPVPKESVNAPSLKNLITSVETLPVPERTPAKLDSREPTSSLNPLASSSAAVQTTKPTDSIKAAKAGRVPFTKCNTPGPDFLASNDEGDKNWDSVELSDDEGWEELIGDDINEWEVVGR